MRRLITFLLFATLCTFIVPVTIVHAEEAFENTAALEGVGTNWRALAPEHYYSGACCYCLPAQQVLPSDVPGHSKYLVSHGPDIGSHWYTLPDIVMRPPDPARPTEGTVICDPVERAYQCVLSDALY